MIFFAARICIIFCVLEEPPKIEGPSYLCDTYRQEMKVLLRPLGKTGLRHDQKAALDSVRRKYHARCVRR